MIGALTRHWTEEPRRFSKPTRSSAPLGANPHGQPVPVRCCRCGLRTATYQGNLPPRWRRLSRGPCCEDC